MKLQSAGFSVTMSFKEAFSLSHTICDSFVHDSKEFENIFFPFEGNATIKSVTQGTDENCSMHFCSSRLEAIFLREAFIAKGDKATVIFNDYKALDNPEEEEYIVLVNRPFSDYIEYKGSIDCDDNKLEKEKTFD